MNILIAEDERHIRNLLQLQLEQEQYSVFSASDGIEALEIIQKENVDLAILDVMMPRLDGFNLLRKIRETSNFPVIFLTARGDDMDKILGLGIGADDYLVKPFSMSELLARVSAQIRRNLEYSSQKTEVFSKIVYGSICLDKHTCCVYKNNKMVEMNAKEFLLLKYMMESPERVFTKKQLYRAVWDEDAYYDNNTIMVHISRLRNKLETDSKNPKYIRTIRGIGYKFHKYSEGTL
ncbi:response regulator transcription factor [Clostridium sp.]|uniref:response regulator transcription factor n=1 Tax=Clostridium sp. TaxID=1506 RepID=UPI003EEA2FE5